MPLWGWVARNDDGDASNAFVLPQLSQKIVPPPTVGEDSGEGERSWMSAPILTFPHHKGEGDEIRNAIRLIQRTLVEQGRYKKDDVLFRSIGVLAT